jgi:ribosome maturation factor RimP
VLNQKLSDIVTPVVESLGYELVLLEFAGATRHGTLRLFIDSPGGITVSDCERVSREIAAVLDVEDPIATPYQLEVSSPGLDRPLVTPAHFQRFIGETVKVQLWAARDNRRRYVGVLVAADEQGIELTLPEGRVQLPYENIERARLVPDFDRELAKS